jgi:hydrogenase maturation protease
MSDHALVIGYGNELRGDDGVGPHVARQLAARRLPGVRALALQQLTLELAEDLAAARLAVFIDARASPGQEAVEVARIEPGGEGPPLTHACHPSALLRLAQILYGSAPEAWLISIAGKNFGLKEGLSDQAGRYAHAAMEHVEAILSTTTPDHATALP